MADQPKQAPREEHAGDTRNIVRAMLWMLVPFTVVGVLLLLVAPTVGMVVLATAVFGWGVFAFYLVFNQLFVQTAGNAFGKVLLPSGSSTPPAKALSHIETMVVRGDLARAVEAYKAEIAVDPADVLSCERLGALAMRQLGDYDLAVWAYREAERRETAPGRRFGYGLIIVGIYRDQLKDRGKTVVELRRLVHQYPDAPRIASLRAEIDELKTGMFDDHGA